jgi:hypothetical protein
VTGAYDPLGFGKGTPRADLHAPIRDTATRRAPHGARVAGIETPVRASPPRGALLRTDDATPTVETP